MVTHKKTVFGNNKVTSVQHFLQNSLSSSSIKALNVFKTYVYLKSRYGKVPQLNSASLTSY